MDKTTIMESLKSLTSNKDRCDFMYSEITKMREDFETTNDLLEDKVYKFVEDFLSNGVDLPKEMQKYIAIGKRYDDFIQMLKCRVRMSEGLLSEQASDLLIMARAEIKKLNGRISGIKADSLEKKADMRVMERQIYCHEQIEKLKTDSHKRRAKQLCEGANSKYKIDQILRQVKKCE